MKAIYAYIFLLSFVSVQSQFLIENGTEIFIKGQANLYSDIELINKGEITFDAAAQGGLFIDAGLDNSTGILTLNDAVLHLGSDTPRADGTQNLIFGNSDNVKFVELGKTTGTYNVTGGLLNITKTLTSHSGTLEANDNIVLKSTSIANTAIVSQSTAGNVNGIRVERFIPADRAFRIMASPVDSDNSVFDNWQQSGLNPGDSGYQPNLGTHITGGLASNGFDQSTSNNPSMFVFDVTNQVWNPINDNTNVRILENSLAYFILIRGDRSIDLSINDFNTEIQTNLNATGSLHIGTKIQSFIAPNADSWITTANPYQAPVDMNQVIGPSNTVFKNSIWVWDQTSNTGGQFVSIADLNNPTPSVPGSNVTENIQPGQAVFVQTINSGNADLIYEEIDKVDNSFLTDVFSETSSNSLSIMDGYIRMGLYNTTATPFSDVAYDGIIVKFDGQYSNGIDQFDAMKLFNNQENMAVKLNNTYLSVNNRKLPSNLDEIIDLSLLNLAESQYVFSIELTGLSSLPNGLLLWDKYLDTFTLLSDQMLINFDVDTSIPDSFAEDRFALVFENKNLSIQEQLLQDVSIYPNPVFDEKLSVLFKENISGAEVEIKIFSVNGKLVKELKYQNAKQRLDLKELNFSPGVYILKVRQGKMSSVFKIIKK
ncbi:T9SS type A sorting domain-containing protein [Flavobacteriaceae bacterium 14752]|uniref:T9SS type A sorting domain-containing protein n=1 Tax=Mesohalobacter salilacus TaxID=2491711 RepID=UPI000F6313BD|nr:T9SS C-terminal target domain-containing protein [Flavobacteriaceae bacterium 14752]